MTIFDGNLKCTTRTNDIVYWFEQENYINCYFYIYEIEISRGGKEDAIEKSKLYVTF